MLEMSDFQEVPVHSKPISTSSNNFNCKFFKRFARLLPWLFPGWRSVSVLLFILLLSLGLLEQVIVYHIGLIPSKYYKVLGDKDHAGFWHQTAEAVGFIAAEAFVKSTTLFIASLLYLEWRDNVTRRLHGKYFHDIVYYSINVLEHAVDNPDQRITQDVDKLCDTLSQIIAPVIVSPFTIAYYIYKAQEGSGYVGPVGVFVFFIFATVINQGLMSPVVRFVFRREEMEGNFRFKHMQIRSNSESAAFLRSGRHENAKANKHLETLISTQRKLVYRQYPLNLNLFDYLGGIFSYLAIGFPIFLGVYNDLSPVDLSSLISVNAFVVIYLINCFTKLIDLSVKVTKIAGTTHRVVEMVESLARLKDDQNSRSACRPVQSKGFGWSDVESLVKNELVTRNEARNEKEAGNEPITAVRLNDVTYTAPGSKNRLCKGLSFQFESGVNILITGPSGCGKSSLLRIINGIWPEVRGCVDHVVDLRPHVILFLPQKPYFTDGSLRQQVLYPLREFDEQGRSLCAENDEMIYEYLEKVQLGHLAERIGGLDVQVNWNWYDKLSPGEMQRLSFVRLFYHRPKFAVLDEATSQIGFDAEQTMYGLCLELGITLMSVGHRDSLRHYHQVELHLDGQGGWSLKPIDQSQPSANLSQQPIGSINQSEPLGNLSHYPIGSGDQSEC